MRTATKANCSITRDGSATAAARYRRVWRWHFYGGLFCLPFVLWLAMTGSIYLFKPQIEAWLDRRYDRLDVQGPPASPQAQAAAALAAVPGATLNAYQLPATPRSAVQVLVGQGAELTRVYVHPHTLEILARVPEERRPMRQIFRLHGELMLGERGSNLVELAACWAIVMILTGLYLWWPRDGRGIAGVLYPRLSRSGRPWWRDLHAVVGFWISALALFLLLSGLPWTQFWGGNLKSLRQWASAQAVEQEWFTSRAEERASIRAGNAAAGAGGHDGHGRPSGRAAGTQADYAALDRLVPLSDVQALPPPVLISPPSQANGRWTARSDTQNRPRRVRLTLDGERGLVLDRQSFADLGALDRLIAVGIAAHEGQLFGWPNQLLGLVTAIGLVTLVLSAVAMWWKRRPAGRLGAPDRLPSPPISAGLVVSIGVLGLLLPLFGLSLIAMTLIERFVLGRVEPLREFLGLQASIDAARHRGREWP